MVSLIVIICDRVLHRSLIIFVVVLLSFNFLLTKTHFQFFPIDDRIFIEQILRRLPTTTEAGHMPSDLKVSVREGLSFLIRASRIFLNCTASCQVGVELLQW